MTDKNKAPIGAEKPTEDPACLEVVTSYLGKLSADLTVKYLDLIAQEPDKLAPISQKTDFLIELAELTGKRDQILEMQQDFISQPPM